MHSLRGVTPGGGRRTRPHDRMRYHYKPCTPGPPPRMSAKSNESLEALSPVDGRYRATTAPLRALLSEAGLIRERVRVEAAWLLHLAAAVPQLPGSQLPPTAQARLRELAANPPAEAAAAVKGVEYYVREQLSAAGATPATLELVHFGCTSEDINNVSYARLLKEARTLLAATLAQRGSELAGLAHRYADAPMPARTH